MILKKNYILKLKNIYLYKHKIKTHNQFFEMKIFLIIIITLLLNVGYANAGTKHEFSGSAFNINTNSEPVTTATGISMGSWNNKSFWIYDNPPEGWPDQVRANCDGKGLFGTEGIPVTAYFICHVWDAEGDTFMTRGDLDPTTWSGT
jgi:hypothetical protein